MWPSAALCLKYSLEHTRLKKRRIFDSDEEDTNTSPGRPNELQENGFNQEPPALENTSQSAAEESARPPKSSGKGKEVRRVEEEANEEHMPPSNNDEGEEEMSELDSDNEHELDKVVASKRCVMFKPDLIYRDLHVPISAEAALSKKDDVDVKGGWKVGDPSVYYVLSNMSPLNKTPL